MGAKCSRSYHPKRLIQDKDIAEIVSDVWNEYEQKRLVGDGASSEVFEAVGANEKHVAIKVIRPEFAVVFENEVRILRKLKSDHITCISRALVDKSGFYIVQDLFDGGELFDRLLSDGSKVCNNEVRAAVLVKQMLTAVVHMHEQDIVHLDLKPENFVFQNKSKNSYLNLVDFGSAVAIQPDTSVRQFLGSLPYSSPEMIGQYPSCTGEQLKKCDTWAIGVITFMLVTGTSPFTRDHEQLTRNAIYNADYVYPQGSRVSPSVKDFISTLLNVCPNKRLSADEALYHPWLSDPRNSSHQRLPSDVLTGVRKMQIHSKFRRSIAKMLSQTMTIVERQKITRVFQDIEFEAATDNLEIESKIAYLLEVGLEMDTVTAAERAKETLNILQEESGGLISLDNLLQAHQMASLTNLKVLSKTFALMDENHDGEIDEEEFVKLIQGSPPDDHDPMNAYETRALATEFLTAYDIDGNGSISFNEFKVAMGANDMSEFSIE